MARPRIEIDWNEFDKLCQIQCTLAEFASWFDCSEDTIERAVKREKKMRFAEYFSKRKGKGLISLRRRQFQKALDGNVTMLIWLGKQYLGQTDKVEDGEEDTQVNITYNVLPPRD